MQIVGSKSQRSAGAASAHFPVGVPAVILLALAAGVLAACSSPVGSGTKVGPIQAADVALVRFNSCADALQGLRAAASRTLETDGFAAGARTLVPANSAADTQAVAPQSAAGADTSGQASAAGSGSYSSTNTATPGVDEPDIVKTDGRRIVTITGNVLRVIDAQTRQITGVLDLPGGSAAGPPDLSVPFIGGLTPAQLLLFGNRALVMFSPNIYPVEGLPTGADVGGSAASASTARPIGPVFGPHLVLVDLSTGTPRILSEFTMDGSLIDARQVGSVARVVVQSAPRFYFPPMEAPGAPGGLAPERAAISHAGLSEWLPRYAVTTSGHRQTGLVDCASVSHPAHAAYTGSSMLTVLTFDLSAMSLGDGEPVTIVADGDTVYSDGASLYIASRQFTATPVAGATSVAPPPAGAASGAPAVTTISPVPAPSAITVSAGTISSAPQVPATQYTSIYKFGISGPGRPVYEAAGTVPGWLLGSAGTAEYSLSAWSGALRVATTTEGAFGLGAEPQSQSAVYVLEQNGSELVVVGKVGGLGAGEQIYAVRFAGPVGYVATFRQVDPLYTLDLSDPTQPKIAGQLQLSGYSAYLYPIDATHLIGIGQDANALGQTTGTQISLFDVSDPASPVRQAVYDLPFAQSDAEFDPHAFLYWPASKLLVIPVQLPGAGTPSVAPPPVPQGGAGSSGSASSGTGSIGAGSSGAASGGTVANPGPASMPESEALVLRVGDSGFTDLGTITHPGTPTYLGGSQILRSLIAGNALWTLSDAGLKASDMTTLAPLAWVRF